MPVAKEQIRQIISDNNISSVADIYALLKDSFKDILQELMEAELDAALGYEKNQKGDLRESADRSKRWAEKNEGTKIGFDPVKEHDRFLGTRSYIGAKTKRCKAE